MSPAEANTRKRFPGLDAVALQHPFDRVALNALQQIPGLDVIMRKFIELFPERIAYIQNVAQTVKVTNTQCSQLHMQLQEACAILDMPEPELYVAHNPLPNAWTSGHNHPYIVVTSGLLYLMNEDEVLGVLGHELGHIKSGHVLYKSMALSIGIVLTIIGDVTLGIGRLVGRGLESALLEWSRKAEFTGDRAGLLVIQDPQVMLSMMMKFAGGTLFQRHEMDAKEFLKQADLYQEADANVLNRIYKGMLVAPVTHPLTIVRAREIMNWSESREYRDILAGRYPRKRTTANASATGRNGQNGASPAKTTSSSRTGLIRCPHCGREQTNERFCSLCGGEIA
jgi:Zn-dependent protease with chaperone function